MEKKKLRPIYLIYPGFYPLLMLNYWIRKSNVPIVALAFSDYEIKHKGQYLNLIECIIGIWQQCGFRYMVYMLLVTKWSMPIVYGWNFLRRILGKEVKIKTYTEIAKENGIPIIRFKNFNSEEMIKFVKNMNANLIVSAYNNQILKKMLFKVPMLGAINIHPALLPNFRGLDGPFEAMFHDVPKAGVTIHKVDTKIDTGPILVQGPVKVRKTDTLFSLSLRCWMHGATVLDKAFKMLQNGSAAGVKQNPKDIKFPYQSFPTKDRLRTFHQKGRKLFTLQDWIRTLRD